MIYQIFLFFLLSILLIVFLFWEISTIFSLIGGIPFVSSTSLVIRAGLKLADLKSNETFYELGSGIGTGLLIASGEFKSKTVGIEISPFHYLISWFRTRKNPKIKIIRYNFKKINISEADVVYCYLSPSLMEDLIVQFKKQLLHGTRVISYCFKIPDLVPNKVETVCGKKIYLYEF